MAISVTTDWAKLRYIMLIIFSTSALLESTVATGLATSGKQKRQLFREHLLPQQGGKIPESAFVPERLSLNKLSQNGFYSADGYIIEERHPNRRFYPEEFYPATIKIHLSPDNNHVAPVGQTYGPRVVDTTYLIRDPVHFNLIENPVRNHPPLPLAPHTSLKLFHRREYEQISRDPWEESFPPNDHEQEDQVLQEFAPYLKKLHEIAYD